MAEQSRQPSGVHENSAVFAPDASVGDTRVVITVVAPAASACAHVY
jgi:hypothetical protein